jgi:hypothetical protein
MKLYVNVERKLSELVGNEAAILSLGWAESDTLCTDGCGSEKPSILLSVLMSDDRLNRKSMNFSV